MPPGIEVNGRIPNPLNSQKATVTPKRMKKDRTNIELSELGEPLTAFDAARLRPHYGMGCKIQLSIRV